MAATVRAWSAGAIRRLSGKGGTKNECARDGCEKFEWYANAVTKQQDILLGQSLSLLRHQLEQKTQSLNDCSFEVTEEWLFEFASLHAEYTEKASSSKLSSHQFRSTTDLLHHVLQHPNVIRMLTVLNKPGPNQMCPQKYDDPQNAWHCAIGEVSRVSEDRTARGIDTLEQCSSRFDLMQQSMHSQSLREARSEEVAQGLTKSNAGSTGNRSSSVATNPGHERRKVFQRRLSAPSEAPCEDGELMQKLRTRASRKSWSGSSPRSLRLAQTASIDTCHSVKDDIAKPGNLAARKKLLEDKLQACGFHNHASGGA